MQAKARYRFVSGRSGGGQTAARLRQAAGKACERFHWKPARKLHNPGAAALSGTQPKGPRPIGCRSASRHLANLVGIKRRAKGCGIQQRQPRRQAFLLHPRWIRGAQGPSRGGGGSQCDLPQ